MNLRKLYILVFVVFAGFFSACKRENNCDCIKRTGTIITETRKLPPFNQIYVENNLNVFIIEDSVSEVRIEAGENIAPLIKTQVEDGVLYLRNKNRCNWMRYYNKPLNVYVHVPQVNYITSDGTGNIKCLNAITTPELDIHVINSGNVDLMINNNMVRSYMHGSGNLTLSGNTNEHAAYIKGTSYLYANGLHTGYTYINTLTLGPCYIQADNILDCKIDEKGDVYCSGNPPTVHVTRNSEGHLYLQ